MATYRARMRVTVDVEVTLEAADDQAARTAAFSGAVDWRSARPSPLAAPPSGWAVVGDVERVGDV